MKNRKKKYNGSTTHRIALLHAIGQCMVMNAGSVMVSDVMPFMNVSKPTAIRHIRTLVENDEVVMSKDHSFGKFGRLEFMLHCDMFDEFKECHYEPYFVMYCNDVLSVR